MRKKYYDYLPLPPVVCLLPDSKPDRRLAAAPKSPPPAPTAPRAPPGPPKAPVGLNVTH